MPVTCIVPGCKSRADKGNLSYYRVPSIKTSKYCQQSNELSIQRQEMWLAAINRDDLTESILRYQRVCSKHFICGKPSPLNDINNPDWVPSQYMNNSEYLSVTYSSMYDAWKERRKRAKRVNKEDVISNIPNSCPEVSKMDINESELQPKTGFVSKTEIPTGDSTKIDPFIKVELCKENSTDVSDNVPKGDVLGFSDKQFGVSKLESTDLLQTNSFEDVKPNVEKIECSSAEARSNDSVGEPMIAEVKVKEEHCFDSPDYVIGDDLVGCNMSRIKTEVEDDSFCENLKVDTVVGKMLEQAQDPFQGSEENSVSCSISFDEGCSAESSFSQEKIHDEANPFSCKFCPESFPSSTALTIHAKIHNGERPFQCKVCSKCFAQRYSLTSHEKIHKGEKPFVCQYCPKAFTNNAYLVVHSRTHTGEKPFHCEVCSKPFAERGSLTRHRRIHNGERPYVCNVCSKAFVNSSALVIHSRMHTGEKPFQCEVCLRCFSCRNGLVRHEKIHTGEKPHKCEHCSKCFSGRSELVVHIRSHTGELYTCKFCPKFFNRPYDVTIHERSHTGEKPHKCKECSKSFVNNSALVVHLRSHTGERPYKCQICSKAYTTSSNLVVHSKVHTAEILGLVEADLLVKDQV